MALDEAILCLHALGRSPPTLRFYGWQPACLSIGYFQSASEVDLAACRAAGVDWVRRPTGGRAILHDAELTYSLVAHEANPLVSGSITASYRKIAAGLVEGLRLLGLPAQAASAGPPGRPLDKTGACFDASAHYEVTVHGRKIVGSAQVRRDGALLQHGSLPLDFQPKRLLALLQFPDEALRRSPAVRLARRSTSLREALGREVSFAEVAAALKEGFQRALGIGLRDGEPSQEERRLAHALRRDKYATHAWNARR